MKLERLKTAALGVLTGTDPWKRCGPPGCLVRCLLRETLLFHMQDVYCFEQEFNVLSKVFTEKEKKNSNVRG